MNPALSVIAFTTLSGAGYGLALVLALGHGNPAALSTKLAWVTALVLIGLGLLSSTLHLGNPQRAWRAFSQWRSSWLSREGVMAMLTFIPLTALTAMSIFGETFHLGLGYLAAIMCGLTVYCTAMIYASLRTVAQWNTGWTPAVYLAFSLTMGTVVYLTFFGPESGTRSMTIWVYLTIVFLLVSWGIKYIWVRRAMNIGYGDSTIESAIGIGTIGEARLLERPHAMENYLTNEMVFRVARKHTDKLWRIALMLGLVLPLIFLVLSLQFGASGGLFLVGACGTLFMGIFVERWLFFATAKHVVGLYYGGEETLDSER